MNKNKIHFFLFQYDNKNSKHLLEMSVFFFFLESAVLWQNKQEKTQKYPGWYLVSDHW